MGMNVFFIGMMIGAVVGVMTTHLYYRRLWKKEMAQVMEYVHELSRIVSSSREHYDSILNLEADDPEQ